MEGRHSGAGQGGLSEPAHALIEPALARYEHGITAIDTDYVRAGLDASHLVVQQGRAAFVDTGTAHAVPRLLAALAAHGLGSDAVDYVFLTHVHLDHAGGAGALLRELPRARVVVHPRGAPHLVDPEALVEASIAVYGAETYARLYGEIVPIDAARLIATTEGERFELAGRPFEIMHTPGHALHHQAIVDLDARGVFTGDTFGLSYREFDVGARAFIVPTTTPTQFDPEQLLDSIARILARRPDALYLTHYGRVHDVERLGLELRLQIEAIVQLAREAWSARGTPVPGAAAREADRVATARIRAGMRELWIDRVAMHGCADARRKVDELLKFDLDLNADGIVAWLRRKPR
jgi:glyoxylase-like metal-dependent hydrolase (beta-lactamase superfamily II)